MRPFLVAALAFAAPALADDPAPAEASPEHPAAGLVEYRHGLMHALGAHMGASAAIVRGKVDRSGDLAMHARAMHDIAQVVGDLFPEGTGPETGLEMESLPAIWEHPDDFSAAATAFQEAAAAFVTATTTEGADVSAAFREVGRTCSGCHDRFRVDEDDH